MVLSDDFNDVFGCADRMCYRTCYRMTSTMYYRMFAVIVVTWVHIVLDNKQPISSGWAHQCHQFVQLHS